MFPLLLWTSKCRVGSLILNKNTMLLHWPKIWSGKICLISWFDFDFTWLRSTLNSEKKNTASNFCQNLKNMFKILVIMNIPTPINLKFFIGLDLKKGFSIWFEIQPNPADYPANIYLFKVNNRNTIKCFEICSKLAIQTPERPQCRCSGVFIANFNIFQNFFYSFYCWLWTSKC